jgi:arylsulfatase A-like enzyme
MTDQQRADSMSCAGHPVIKTPHMDRLAAEGVRFSNAYTPSPVCMPARSSFLTGLYCHNHGQWGNYGHLPEDADTYCHRVKAVGYHTCHIGKSHYYSHRRFHLDEHKPFLNALGWQEVYETTGPQATRRTDSIMTDHWREIGCLDTFREDYARRAEVGHTAALWPSPMPEGETLDDFVGRTAVEYIEGYDREQSLLLFVGFPGPHPPWDPPADWAKRYDPADMPQNLPPIEPPEWLPPATAEHARKQKKEERQITPEISAQIRILYYAKISHIDWWMGRILDALTSRGMLENTAVILWSDHGEMLCDKHRIGKSVFYEQAVKVPLILRPPVQKPVGKTCSRLVSTVDLFSTILELAGCEPKEDAFGPYGPPVWGGKSLMPFLADVNAPHHDAVFSEIDFRTMIRDERFKMVVDYSGNVLKLYHLLDDPKEEVNLVGKKGTEEAVSRLRDRMLNWYLTTQLRQKR